MAAPRLRTAYAVGVRAMRGGLRSPNQAHQCAGNRRTLHASGGCRSEREKWGVVKVGAVKNCRRNATPIVRFCRLVGHKTVLASATDWWACSRQGAQLGVASRSPLTARDRSPADSENTHGECREGRAVWLAGAERPARAPAGSKRPYPSNMGAYDDGSQPAVQGGARLRLAHDQQADLHRLISLSSPTGLPAQRGQGLSVPPR